MVTATTQEPKPLDTTLAAEAAVLGSILIWPDRLPDVMAGLRPSAFRTPAYRLIYEGMLSAWGRDTPMEVALLAEEMQRLGTLDEAGGLAGIIGLMDAAPPSGANADRYARLVAENAKRRELAGLMQSLAETAQDGRESVEESVAHVMSRLDLLVHDRPSHAVRIGEIAKRKIERMPRIQTSFEEIDEAINGGLAPTDFLVVGGGPKVGKTQFALQIVERSAKVGTDGKARKAAALFLSLEMSDWEVECRMIARVGHIPLGAVMRMRSGQAWQETMDIYGERFRVARESVAAYPLFVCTTPSTIHDVSAMVARHRNEIDFVVVDYLQLLSNTEKGQSEYERVTEASRLCKRIAQRYQRPVIAVSQLNRTRRENHGKPPTMDQLRSSGQIEQDANQIILLHRPDPEDDDNVVDMDAILAANRNGPAVKQELSFNQQDGRFFPRVPKVHNSFDD